MATRPCPSEVRSPSGTPSSSQITVNGRGKANLATRSTGASGSRSGQDVEEVVHDGLHPRPQPLDSAHRERRRHETTQPGVIRRVHGEHVPGELGPREALGHHPAAQGERGVHVLGEPGVIERLPGLVVAHHEPGVVAVGQGDVVHRAEFTDFGEQREGVVPVEGAPRSERRLDAGASLAGRRSRTRGIDGVMRHGEILSTESAAR